MFEDLRRALDELLARATKPEDRRLLVARMKTTLVQASLGLDDLRRGLEQTRRSLEAERRELVTVQRRKQMASGIADHETVTVAERFERQHTERIAVLEQKVVVQEQELELAEREVASMKAEIRAAMSGGGAASEAGAPLEDPLADPAEARARDDLDAMARERSRAERDAEAERRLEELKRRMGR